MRRGADGAHRANAGHGRDRRQGRRQRARPSHMAKGGAAGSGPQACGSAASDSAGGTDCRTSPQSVWPARNSLRPINCDGRGPTVWRSASSHVRPRSRRGRVLRDDIRAAQRTHEHRISTAHRFTNGGCPKRPTWRGASPQARMSFAACSNSPQAGFSKLWRHPSRPSESAGHGARRELTSAPPHFSADAHPELQGTPHSKPSATQLPPSLSTNASLLARLSTTAMMTQALGTPPHERRRNDGTAGVVLRAARGHKDTKPTSRQFLLKSAECGCVWDTSGQH